MKETSKDRIHSLDALRAVMMLLGVVLHTALTYNDTNHAEVWTLKDPNTTSIVTDVLVLVIHSFRMPIFFMVAGFFGALLFYNRGFKSMIYNRFSRIVLPFIVFLFLLWPIIIYTFTYTEAVFSGTQNPNQLVSAYFDDFRIFLPNRTVHLWFLYYLALITAFTSLFALIIHKIRIKTSHIWSIVEFILCHPILRIGTFSILLFGVHLVLETATIDPSVSLILSYPTFIYYCTFYLFGWILFRVKNCLTSFANCSWRDASFATVLVLFQGLLIDEFNFDPMSNDFSMLVLSALITTLYLFGISGLFIKYTSKPSPRFRYISDSSYWVYLIHLPITAYLPSCIYTWPLPALVKFLIVTTTASFICLITYHFFVRNTFIGKFLNGRKYSVNQSSHLKTYY